MLDLCFKFILNDDDTYLSNVDKLIVREWIKNNYCIYGDLTISDDLVVDCSGHVHVKNKNIESLTNGLFRWGNVDRDFYCSDCKKLKSLEGAPEEVDGYFYCNHCDKLENLKGAPKKLKGNFYCNDCINLKSLEGAPEVEGGKFVYSNCPNLKITDSDRKRYKLYKF